MNNIIAIAKSVIFESEDVEKIIKTMESCENRNHIQVANKMIILYAEKWERKGIIGSWRNAVIMQLLLVKKAKTLPDYENHDFNAPDATIIGMDANVF
jgi:hypothetical protein